MPIKRNFVYINSHAAHFLHDKKMKKYITNKIGHSKWKACNEVMIPEILQEDFEIFTEAFFHGITTYQYTMLNEGGTFINPLLYGLTTDFELWNDVIHSEPDFYQNVTYVDIPYSVYKEVAEDDSLFVTEEEYMENSNKLTGMVEQLKSTYYPSNTILH